MASAPSLSEAGTTSIRVSLVRTGEAPESAWLAEVDELPNCSGRGMTPEEAVRRAWAAANSLPHEAERSRHSGKLLVRMPATLHDELARTAEEEGVSLNQLITGILAGAVEWRSSDPTTENPAPGGLLSARATTGLLAANFAVVLIAAVVAISVLVAAWRSGF
jgi:antitoxin HicB